MCIYQNSNFGFKITFPAKWSLRCWKNWKRKPDETSKWQMSDSDLPIEGGCKTLFISLLKGEVDPVLPDAAFSMEVYSRQGSFDLSDLMLARPDESGRRYEIERLMGRQCQTVSFVCESGGLKRFVKSVLWEESSNVWLGASMDASTIEDLKHTYNLLMGAERTSENR